MAETEVTRTAAKKKTASTAKKKTTSTAKKKTTSSSSLKLSAAEKKLVQNYRKCDAIGKKLIAVIAEKASDGLSLSDLTSLLK